MDQSKLAKERYKKMVEKASPNSSLFMNCLKAFIVGGLICDFGQFLLQIFQDMGSNIDDARLYTSIFLVLTGVLLTGLGLYQRLGRVAGAGSIVPITGFANSVASPAIEYKKEGLIMGVGAKMFTVAGPVIVYGTLTSMIVGLVYYVVKEMF